MHRTTARIKETIDRLNSTTRNLVVRELLELLRINPVSVSEQFHPANLTVPPKDIFQFLKDKCNLVAGEDSDSVRFDLFHCSEVDRVGEGLERVKFDFENHECTAGANVGEYKNLLGPRLFGKVPAVGCAAGGDWEYPVFFIIYLDEDGQTLRAYVPKEGNVWNYDSGEAFGNDDDADSEFLGKWVLENLSNVDKVAHAQITNYPMGNAELMFNEETLLKDIEDNLTTLERIR